MTEPIQQPPFRADHVGSLLRPERIKKARSDFEKGLIERADLRTIEDEEITRIVEEQKKAGLQAVTDGELRRGWWHFDFLEGLDGVEGYTAEDGIQFQGKQTKSRAIKVTGKLGFTDHPMLEDFSFLQKAAGRHTAKMTIPSPSMLHFRGEIDSTVYKNEEDFFTDLAEAYKKAIQAFYEAGCRYLQLDDTSWAYFCSEEQLKQLRERGKDPEEMKKRYAETINKAISERPDDMKITMHICRGNFRSTWISSGGYEPVAKTLFEDLKIDGFFLEYDTDRAGGFEPLRFIKRSDLQIVLGLITSKSGALEEKEEVKQRIQEASHYVPMNQLNVSPQCGFASTEEGNLLTEEEQWAKLRHTVEIANDVWNA
ncbi:5-methyltetrahydropteroyltriglutamate--homocysteine S-methyltransferase [Alteribacillus iranensis]|uniref:5-methyltetrahydropteroyltriglutamate--homocysteine methyltransferase n=1 Tax=Alteribacillus iranensis TaxID=930128 RepID=A0A1I2E5R5_9BACI|nr:5-methyltetrahydropteroyltriglutamate--homocysteine S-methyltransferase [Alteribacillus iranensis]SFE87986.1 5-methyltetrahydropteroyltriglutamate--homocysteine methyltransferase [Alteribacillus iranensis]